MPVNPDASQNLEVSFRDPRVGSCFTKAALAELAQLIVVKIPTSALSSSGSAYASKDANNIASIDAEGGILVPAAKLYEEEQTWEASGGADLEFTDFADQQIDATQCGLGIFMFLDSAETGKTTGGVNTRPNWELKERSAGKVVIAVKNANSDVRVVLQLTQFPVPQEKA